MTAESPSGAIHQEQAFVRAYPANVTFHDLIRSNKRKSALLVAAMILLGIVIGAAIAAGIAAYGGAGTEALVPSLALGAVVAGALGTGASLWSFYGGSDAILRMSGAQEMERSQDPQLDNVIEELAIAAGIPKPKIYLIDSPALNAFATGRDPEHGAVAITRGLRERLTRDELAGVMAHEISHIRHYDIRFAMLMATMVGLIVLMSDMFWRMMRYGALTGGSRRSSRSDGKGGNPVMIVVLVIAVLLAIVAPILATVIRFAMSRQREYLADAGAVELTRYPQGMISALQKLGASDISVATANKATAHLYIVNPLRNAMTGQGHELSSVFRTHPPLRDRIQRLQALIG